MRGTQVEKLNASSPDEAEYLGMRHFTGVYLRLYDRPDGAHEVLSDRPKKFVEEIMKEIVQDSTNYRVTYDGDGSASQAVTYSSATGFNVEFGGMKDDGPNKKFRVSVPTAKPNPDDTYVTNILRVLGAQPTPENRRYLLGLILLRKCR